MMHELVRSEYCYWLFFPLVLAINCVFINRLAGRKEDKCPTWKDKLQMGFIYFMCILANMFVAFICMIGQKAWLILHWNLNKPVLW